MLRARHVLGRGIAVATVTILLLSFGVPNKLHALAASAPAPSLPASCKPSTSTVNSKNCYVALAPARSFVALGSNHTVTFTCDALTASMLGQAAVPSGCYDLTASVANLTTGSPAQLSYGRCGASPASVSGGTMNCSSVQSPLCPVTTLPGGAQGPVVCASSAQAGAGAGNTASVYFGANAAHRFDVTFSGYTPVKTTCQPGSVSSGGSCATSAGPTRACPAGFQYEQGPFTLENSGHGTPILVSAPDGVCHFVLAVEVDFIELTSVGLVADSHPCGGLGFRLGTLDTFYGRLCFVTSTASGRLVVGPCSQTPRTPPLADGYPGGTYRCSNNTLTIIGLPVSGAGLRLDVTSGNASFNVLGTRKSNCTGDAMNTSSTGFTGAKAPLCPTAPGPGTVRACALTVDTQPSLCSAPLAFSYTEDVVTCAASASPSQLSPINGKFVFVRVNLTHTAGSAILKSLTTNQGDIGTESSEWNVGTFSTSGLLQSARTPADSVRTYTLTYQITGPYGTIRTCTTSVTV